MKPELRFSQSELDYLAKIVSDWERDHERRSPVSNDGKRFLDLYKISDYQYHLLDGASKGENPDIDALLLELNDDGGKLTKDQVIHLLKQAKLQGEDKNSNFYSINHNFSSFINS